MQATLPSVRKTPKSSGASHRRIPAAPSDRVPPGPAQSNCRPDDSGYVQRLFDDALRNQRDGRINHAVKLYKRALSLRPGYADAHNNLGAAFLSQGRIIDAITHYRHAIALNPMHGNAHNNLGTALVSLGLFADAIPAYKRALALNPRQAETHFSLGIALAAQGRIDDAIASYREALLLRSDYAEAHNNLGNLLANRGNTDEAIGHLQKALAGNPHNAETLNNLGCAFRDLGRFEEAMALYDRAIALRPASAEVHYNRSEIKTYGPGDTDLAVLKTLAGSNDMPSGKAPYIHFALAKALEDSGDYDGAFEQLRRGNDLRRDQIHYDESVDEEMFRRTTSVFNRSRFDRHKDCGDPSNAPIFVLGMPRSGSTLIEQILASHPQVHGAGELEDLAACLPPGFPESVAQLDGEALRRIGQSYLARLPRLPDGKVRIVDKLPHNFLRIGLIRMILPNARIIHTLRDPIDTCVSCYSKLFTNGQHFTYDLAELGRYYRRYCRLMTHWQSVIPADAILNVTYENVVDDLEGQARRLIRYCGLPWDDRCLSFYKTSRIVKTASAISVRKPVFRSSLQRWRKYGAGIQALLDELGDLIPGQEELRAA